PPRNKEMALEYGLPVGRDEGIAAVAHGHAEDARKREIGPRVITGSRDRLKELQLAPGVFILEIARRQSESNKKCRFLDIPGQRSEMQGRKLCSWGSTFKRLPEQAANTRKGFDGIRVEHGIVFRFEGGVVFKGRGK